MGSDNGVLGAVRFVVVVAEQRLESDTFVTASLLSLLLEQLYLLSCCF